MTTPRNSLHLVKQLQPYLEDEAVEEVMLNQPGELFIEKGGQIDAITVPELTGRRLLHFFQLVARENHQVLDEQRPLLSGVLPDGARIQLVAMPVAKAPTFSIRKPQRVQKSLQQMHNDGFFVGGMDAREQGLTLGDKTLVRLYEKKQWRDFLIQAVIAKKNIVVAGGTSSGKTTLLNALLHEIPLDERVIVLEDTREIRIPHANQVNLLAMKDTSNKQAVTMQDCVQCTLRLRPDRLIMGEVRGREMQDFVALAMTGHGGNMMTVHAGSAAMAFDRMVQLYKLNPTAMSDGAILREINQVVDIVVHVAKVQGWRQVTSIVFNGVLPQVSKGERS